MLSPFALGDAQLNFSGFFSYAEGGDIFSAVCADDVHCVVHTSSRACVVKLLCVVVFLLHNSQRWPSARQHGTEKNGLVTRQGRKRQTTNTAFTELTTDVLLLSCLYQRYAYTVSVCTVCTWTFIHSLIFKVFGPTMTIGPVTGLQ